MSHIDTLKTYDDLVASGCSEQQARAYVNTLDKSFDGVVTKEHLSNELRVFDKDLKLFFTTELIAIVLVLIAIPNVISFIKKKFIVIKA